MDLRLAKEADLPALKVMFESLIETMGKNGIKIWNAYYPFEEFAGDIEDGNLYVLTKKNEIAAAFSLLRAIDAQNCFEWKEKEAKAAYLTRLGVNTRFLHQGLGAMALEKALRIAKQRGAKFLRLLVVDINEPALALYKKTGFTQVLGEYKEATSSPDEPLIELGFEKPCS